MRLHPLGPDSPRRLIARSFQFMLLVKTQRGKYMKRCTPELTCAVTLNMYCVFTRSSSSRISRLSCACKASAASFAAWIRATSAAWSLAVWIFIH